jgi:hypothetical protein
MEETARTTPAGFAAVFHRVLNRDGDVMPPTTLDLLASVTGEPAGHRWSRTSTRHGGDEQSPSRRLGNVGRFTADTAEKIGARCPEWLSADLPFGGAGG